MRKLFKINKENEQDYRFEVKNEAGQSLFNSVPFSKKSEAKTTIKKLQTADTNKLLFERKTNYDGKFQFNIKTTDSIIIGNSSLFQSQAGMENAIRQMKRHLDAQI